jgi:hypothetical protein
VPNLLSDSTDFGIPDVIGKKVKENMKLFFQKFIQIFVLKRISWRISVLEGRTVGAAIFVDLFKEF